MQQRMTKYANDRPVLQLLIFFSFRVFRLTGVDCSVTSTHQATLCQQAGRIAVPRVLDKSTHCQSMTQTLDTNTQHSPTNYHEMKN